MSDISDKVSIVMATRYQTNNESDWVRADLARRTVEKARNLGYEVIIVDGGSKADLLNAFESSGAILKVEPPKEGETTNWGLRRRMAFQIAYERNKPVIVWTEPEKEPFISQIEKVVYPILEGKADISIPRRKSIASYPSIQQDIERFANAYWEKLTGLDLDIWFGPRAWKRDITNYFLDYKGDYGDRWEVTFVPILRAIMDGKKVADVKIDYLHPSEQTAIEEDNLDFFKKRAEQLHNVVSAVRQDWEKIHSAK